MAEEQVMSTEEAKGIVLDPTPESDEIQLDANTPILDQLPMDEELWTDGPTRADVEKMKKEYPSSDIRATLMANESGILWRTLNRQEWRDLNALVRNVQDENKKEEILFQKICLYPDVSDAKAIDKLPAGVLPAVMQEFYLYSGFQPVADSIKL